MNPRDLPEVVAELIIEMHEVRSELRSIREEQRGMREEMHAIREEMHAMPDRIGAAVFKSMEPFLNRLLDHDDQLKTHEQRLTKLEDPK